MEKKDFTLITFIGKNDTKYETLDYIFPEKGKDEKNERVKTNSTALALIEAKEQHWNITRVIIVGTYTSRWGELVKEDDNKELHVELEEKSKLSFKTDDEVDILDASLDKMVDFLQEKYGIEIIPVAHRPDLSDNTVLEIAEYYDGIFNYIEDTSNILVDITHGFRHMPLLLFQMLQQHLLLLEDKTVEIIYGEMKKEEGISTFRDLKKYWDVTKHTNALNRFLTQYDGDGLVPYLEEIGLVRAASWIKDFSNAIKMNYVMQIYGLSERLASVINEIEDKISDENNIPWLDKLKNELVNIQSALSPYSYPYDIFIAFAHLLEEKRLITQAVIATASAIESRMAVYNARSQGLEDEFYYVGNYDVWANELREELRNMLPFDTERRFKSFYKKRNLIAHGGNKLWQGTIQDNQFSLVQAYRLVSEIFSILDNAEEGLVFAISQKLDAKEMTSSDKRNQNYMIGGTIGDSMKMKEEKRDKKNEIPLIHL